MLQKVCCSMDQSNGTVIWLITRGQYFEINGHQMSCRVRLRLCNIGFQWANRNPLQNFWELTFCIRLDFVWQVWVPLDPIGQLSNPVVPAKSLFSCHIVKLFNYCMPHQFISHHFSHYIVNLFNYYLPHQFIPTTSMSPHFRRQVEANDWSEIWLENEIQRGKECQALIGLSDSLIWTNKKTWFNAILYSHQFVQSHWFAVPIDQSSRLTPIRSDPLMGPTKSQP